jgi:hypothetical protein
MCDIDRPLAGVCAAVANLRLTREPATTNAPDQGYPTVRNLRRVPLQATPVVNELQPR